MNCEICGRESGPAMVVREGHLVWSGFCSRQDELEELDCYKLGFERLKIDNERLRAGLLELSEEEE